MSTLTSDAIRDEGAHDFRLVLPARAGDDGSCAETALSDARHLPGSIHPLDQHSFHEAAQRSLEQLGILRWQGRVVRPDGAIRLVTITLRPERHTGDSTLWHGLVTEPTAPADQDTGPEAAGGAPKQIDGDTLAILGHDMGTPLTAITTAADLAMQVLESPKGSGTDRHEDLVQCLWAVRRNAARLELLRDGLLNMVSSEAGRLVATPAPVLLRPRLQAAVALVDARSRVDLDCDAGLTCSVQPSHLDQMVLNLLVNADKYAGGAVVVRAVPDGEDVTIAVEDRGPGVPVAFRGQLFRRFTRHETTASLPGTGLGLYIVHELATANGGCVAFAPARDGGSRFTVTLPGPRDHGATRTSR